MARGDLTVRLLGDVRDLEKKLEGLSGRLQNIGSKMASVGKKLTTHLTLPILAAGFASISAATRLEESIQKINAVFGSSAPQIIAWSHTTASSIGLSGQAALDAVGEFGNLFEELGVGPVKAAQMSEALVNLSADLAAFHGTSQEDAFSALEKGITGQTRGLKRLGIVIDNNTIKQEAQKLGLIGNTQAMASNRGQANALADAEEGLSVAKENTAARTVSAARAIRDADRGVVDAEHGLKDSARGVQDAEKNLRQAQIDAKTAQQSLTDARKAARQTLEDLQLQVEGNSISEARAALAVEDAQKQLQAAYASGDPEEIAKAQLDVRDAHLQVQQAQEKSARDQDELNKKQKQGVEGSDQVKSAKDQIAQANDAVTKSTQGVVDATYQLAQATQSVKDAEERASDARKDRAKTAKDNARELADAQKRIARATEKTTDSISAQSDVLTPAIKAQAIYQLILEKTGKVQGFFKKHSQDAAEQTKILKARTEDEAAAIGTKLLPTYHKLLDFGNRILDWFTKLSPKTQDTIIKFLGIAAAVGPLLVVLGRFIKVLGFIGQAFGVLTKLFLANPWLLLIAAVIALVIIIVRNWTTIKHFLGKVWDGIKKAASAVFGFLKNIFLNFTPEGQIIKHWAAIKSFFLSIWNGIKTAAIAVFGFLKNLFLNFTPVGQIIKHWSSIVASFKAVWSGIKNGFKDVWNFVVGSFKGAINFLIDAWNKLDFGIDIHVPSWVPLIGGKGFKIKDIFPDIPRLAEGGIAYKSTIANIGEAGPEAVIPLKRSGLLGGTTNVYHITNQVAPGANLAEVGRVTVSAIEAYEKRSGRKWRATA